MGNPQPPGLNILEANCPHCGVRSDFTEHSLYRDDRDGSKPPISADGSDDVRTALLVHRRGKQEQPCAVQVCVGCGGLLFYVGARCVYPSAQISILPFADVPSDLKERIRAAIQFRVIAPAYAAVLLRQVLEDLCKRAGMTDAADGAYAAYLLTHPKAPQLLREKVEKRCIRPYGQPAGAKHIYDIDTEECVFGLEELIDNVAAALL